MKKFFKLFSLVLFVTVLFGGSYALNAQKSVIAESQDVEDVQISAAKDGWMTWYLEDGNGHVLGNTSSGAKEWGIYNRFTPADFAQFDAVGKQITQIKCYPYSHSSSPSVITGLTAVVYQGGSVSGTSYNPGTLVSSQVYPWDNVYNEEKVIDLDNPVTIDGTQEIWIGVVINFTSGYVALTDAGTVYQSDKGDIMSMASNGVTEFFKAADALSSGEWPYNWFVQAYVAEGGSSSSELINADFEIGRDGEKVAQTYAAAGYDFFTTWSSAPGGAEDPVFSNEQVYQGSLSAKLTYDNDFVMLLGDKTSGHYGINFKAYVPTGKDAYFNVLHVFAGSSSEWACEVYINHSTSGTTINVAGQAYDFTWPMDAWNDVYFDIDLDNDLMSFYVNSEMFYEGQFSLDASKGTRQLAAMDFFPPTSAAKSQYYVDNIVVSDLNAGGGTIFGTDFDDLAVGSRVAASYPDFWTTWSNAPGGAEDGTISNEQALSGRQSAKFAYGNDCVFLAGDKTSGAYTIDFNIYVANGMDAYFNVLHAFAGSSSEWACEIYINNSSNGTSINVAGEAYTFTYNADAWNSVHFDIDLDNDLAAFYFNDVLVLEWQFSLDASKGRGTRQLAAMDFYPPTSAAKSTFYVDDFVYAEVGGGATYPVMNVDVTSISATLNHDQTASEDVTISNTGTSIGDFAAWVSYNSAKGGDGNYILSYCGEMKTGVGFNEGTPLVECGARFPSDYYSSFLGTELTQVTYYCGSYDVVNNSITMRVYGQGTSTTPGALLAEKTITYQQSYWVTATFDTPVQLNGGDIWITAEFIQTEGSYPISFDGGNAPYNEDGDWFRQNNGPWQRFENSEWGNICIRAFASGTPTPAWVYLSGETEGALKGGESNELTVMIDPSVFNAHGDFGTYNANLFIATNDDKNPLFTIPVTLNYFDGIENNEAAFTMYPNPAASTVNVKAETAINNVVVYNEIGQVVYSAKANGNTASFSVDGFGSGVYFVRIDTASGINISKLIVR